MIGEEEQAGIVVPVHPCVNSLFKPTIHTFVSIPRNYREALSCIKGFTKSALTWYHRRDSLCNLSSFGIPVASSEFQY